MSIHRIGENTSCSRLSWLTEAVDALNFNEISLALGSIVTESFQPVEESM